MSYFEFGGHTPAAVPCCLCGAAVSPPNSSNMCVNCIRSQVDISEGIPKQVTIQWCKGCGRYHEPPGRWLVAQLESKELLSFCLRRVKQVNKVKLIDANFVWTEPHSKRIKVKLTIQKEVFTNTILQQVFIIEFVVSNLFCPDCHKVEAGSEHTWVAVAQVRQHVTHKRTFYWLEQLILKHAAHQQALSIKEEPEGLDFYFSNQNHCTRFVDFLQAISPLRYRTAKKLVSHDVHSNIFAYKHTFSVEIPPICKDDLVCLPANVARQLGNISPVVLVYKVSNLFHVLDPWTLQTAEMSSPTYWHSPFRSIATKTNLVEFIVLDIEPLSVKNGKMVLAEITVAKNSDFGRNDRHFLTRTHLGHLLNPGDMVLGYDLSTANFNDQDLVGLRGGVKNLPDIVLVRKSYPQRRNKIKQRHWKLKALAKEREESLNRRSELEKADKDYEEFLADLEEDPELRAQINLFKAEGAIAPAKPNEGDMDVDDEEADFPEVTVDELLDDMEGLSLQDPNEAVLRAAALAQEQQQQMMMMQQQQQQQEMMMMQQQQQQFQQQQQGFANQPFM